MRDFLSFLTALALLALVQALTAALSMALLVLVLMGAVVFPRQTLALMIGVSLLATATGAPAACAAALGAIGVAVVVTISVHRRIAPHRVGPALLLPVPRPTAADDKM